MLSCYLRTCMGLALALACLAGCGPAERCYFCVVPQTLPDGQPSAQACRELECWFCRQAGGFTRCSSLQGAWMDGQRRVEEDNVGYLVVGPPGLQGPMEAMIRQRFQQTEPFVVTWPVGR